LRAVILAGGLGSRLAPYTTILPKPLMPLGDMPIIELLIRGLKKHDINQITLSVGYLSSLLMAYLGDGGKLNLPIEYSHESEPLGTAGPLAIVPGLDSTFLAMNGDLLTDLDFSKMIAFHRENKADATVGIFGREVKIDFGVIKTDEQGHISDYIEKPVFSYLVSMGVYVLEPVVLEYIPRNTRFDFPDLIKTLLLKNKRVCSYVHSGYWLDIGRPDDYLRAQNELPLIQAYYQDSKPEALKASFGD
jgi:NDP-mannose synthase